MGSGCCLPRGDKTRSMPNVGDGEFGRMSPQRLLKGRTMFGVQPRDGGNADTSRGLDLAC